MTTRKPMLDDYTMVIQRDGRWWIGWIAEVPGVNCQERSRGELVESLAITLREAIELDELAARG